MTDRFTGIRDGYLVSTRGTVAHFVWPGHYPFETRHMLWGEHRPADEDMSVPLWACGDGIFHGSTRCATLTDDGLVWHGLAGEHAPDITGHGSTKTLVDR